jgi:hypothetical protein
MSGRSIEDKTLEVLFAGLLRCVKKSFLGIAFAGDFLVEKGYRSLYLNKMGLLRNISLVNQKKSGSCRCIFRKLRIGHSSCDDVT